MKLVDVVQGTDEWIEARLGRPTSSQFDRILTPSKLGRSKSSDKYLYELLMEWLIGEPLDQGTSAFMERGSVDERQARAWYAFQHDADVTEVGLVTTDDGRIGCSPDGLIGDSGGLEIKVPGARKFSEYLGGLDPIAHRLQIQGGIWVCEKSWWDFLAYHHMPNVPNIELRFERDDRVISLLSEAVLEFCDKLESEKVRLRERGAMPRSELEDGAS